MNQLEIVPRSSFTIFSGGFVMPVKKKAAKKAAPAKKVAAKKKAAPKKKK
ncbi:MAG TPA: hypothetical protein VF335_10305 [Chitinivibrionales bacterium]